MRRPLQPEGCVSSEAQGRARGGARPRDSRVLGLGALGRSRPHRVYEKGRLRIDFDAYEVFVDGRKIALLLREYEILCFFIQSPNRVFSRQQVLQLVWGRDADIDPRTVDVHIRRLRMRIERDDTQPELIVTVRGVGYKFDDRPLLAASADTTAARFTNL